MIQEELLAKEFISVVQRFYPRTGQVLHDCYVKVIITQLQHSGERLRYVGIYCPSDRMAQLEAEKDVLREVAVDMGLTAVVCMNATRLLSDPFSKIKHVDPRFWLELHWVSSTV